MKLRVVVDSNVYVSAIVFGGPPKSLLTLVELGEFEIVTSAAIRQEVERTLKRKFEWPQEEIDKACTPLWAIGHDVDPSATVAVTDDIDDNRILECALEGSADLIITGDDDLLRLKNFEGIEILKPRSFLNRYQR